MRPKSTTGDLPSTYDVKVRLHNKFVKHIKELKQAITVSELFLFRMNRKLTGHVGGSSESINYRGWMVSGYHKDGVSWDDSALDRGERGKVEVESGDDWLQGFIRCS